MIQLNGKYTNAIIYTDKVDSTTLSQVTEIINNEVTEGSNVRIMSDCHAGKGCVIGTTMTIKDKIVPNLVGVDIGCGVTTCIIPKSEEFTLEELEEIIRRVIPYGFEVHKHQQIKKYESIAKYDIQDLKCIQFINENRAYKSVGTLGGGNHFIELGINEKEEKVLFIHSGSRNLGKQVCEFYQDLAIKQQDLDKAKRNTLINDLKSKGREKDIEEELLRLKKPTSNKYLAYLEGTDKDNYLHDMAIAQDYASVNRKVMIKNIMNELNIVNYEMFDTIHNYIDIENNILRKGAISAQKGEKLAIPINMRDGIIIGEGKGNEDWNYSAPHGAGRILSRGEAKRKVSLEEFTESMEGIFTTCVNKNTIDESPMAYKPIEDILDNIEDTVEVHCIVKPIYNFKAN